MNVQMDTERKWQVGDIIEFGDAKHREHPFYMICEMETEGFFVMSLTGKKSRPRYYRSLRLLQSRMKNVINVISQDEFEIKISRKR